MLNAVRIFEYYYIETARGSIQQSLLSCVLFVDVWKKIPVEQRLSYVSSGKYHTTVHFTGIQDVKRSLCVLAHLANKSLSAGRCTKGVSMKKRRVIYGE